MTVSSLTFIGTSAKHHPNPVVGELRFNTDIHHMETYNGTKWIKISDVGNITEYNLDIGEGTVLGQPYYTVAPMNADFKWGEMMSWMVDTFGPTGNVWDDSSCRWYANNAKFWLRNKKDLDWFVLRWSTP